MIKHWENKEKQMEAICDKSKLGKSFGRERSPERSITGDQIKKDE